MGVDYTPTLGDYSGIRPFRFWCQKVLPLVYDDSLSYYELLNKVVDYLNHTIKDVATAEDNIEALHNAYEQLQAYVNNYFDNLDVTEEIDNKLDEMVLDGTFSRLINPIVLRNINPIAVESVSEMTDKNRLYILKSNKHLYQHNGTEFVDTGIVYGGDLSNVVSYYGTIADNAVLTDLPAQSIYYVSVNYLPIDIPIAGAGFIETVGTQYVKKQVFTTNTTNRMFVRNYYSDTGWTDWSEIDNSNCVKYSNVVNYGALADLPEQTIYLVASDYHPTDLPENSNGYVETIGSSLSKIQTFTSLSTNREYMRIFSGSWKGWVETTNNDTLHYAGVMTSPSTIGALDNQTIAVIDRNYSPSDAPISGSAFVLTIGDSSYRKQCFYGNEYYERTWLASQEWDTWYSRYELNGNPESRLMFVGNVIFNGMYYTDNAYTRAPITSNPMGMLASGIKCSRLTTQESGNGFLSLNTTGRNHSDAIRFTVPREYDVLVTNLYPSDMGSGIGVGTVNSTSGDGTIAGAVIRDLEYIRNANPNCAFVLLGLLPITAVHSGDDVYTQTWGNGSTLNQLESVMVALANKYHFTFVSFKDWYMTYHYRDQVTDNSLPNNANVLRSLGSYINGRVGASLTF